LGDDMLGTPVRAHHDHRSLDVAGRHGDAVEPCEREPCSARDPSRSIERTVARYLNGEGTPGDGHHEDESSGKS